MKKMLLIAVPVALVAVFFVASLTFGFGRGHGRHAGLGKDFLMYKLDKMAEELNLNASQQAKLDALKRDIESKIEGRKDTRQEMHQIFESELAKENPDINKLKGLIHARIDDHSQFAHQMVDRLGEFFAELSPEQKKQLGEKIQKFHDMRHD